MNKVIAQRDSWGESAVAVLGDSISFGVGASDPLPEHSYISFVKKAFQKHFGKLSYGFTSAYPTSWQPNNHAHEIHGWPERSQTGGEYDWICDNNDDGTRLISVGMTATKNGATLTFAPREPYKDMCTCFCVYYHCEPGGGDFTLSDGKHETAGDIVRCTEGAERITNRTPLYRLCDFADGKFSIRVVSDGKPVTITGVGYYRDRESVVFNSYTRGGISLINLSDTVLVQATSAPIVIFALGYNDAYYHYQRVLSGEFTAKINFLIEVIKARGTRLTVNNYIWDNPKRFEMDYGHADEATQKAVLQAMALVRREVKRLADETDGIYIDQQALLGDAILEDLNSDKADGVHPSDAGHRMIARNVVKAMGLEWTEEWTL